MLLCKKKIKQPDIFTLDLHPFLADSIVEEAQVKLTELEKLIKEALERNVVLINADETEVSLCN